VRWGANLKKEGEKIMRRWSMQIGAIGLVLALFISPTFVASAAENTSYGEVNSIQETYTPERFASQGLVAQDKQTFLKLVLEQMLARSETFTVTYQGALKDVYSTFQKLLDEVYTLSSTRADAEDYLKYSCKQMSVNISYNSSRSIFTFRMSYLTSAAQEAYISERVAEIIKQLGVQTKSDLKKLEAVHQYICTNFQYDNSATKYSAYDGLAGGKMVCQGFTLTFYRLMRELNVPVRIVSGYGNGAAHAWNIVKLNGVWYNVDETWDTVLTSGATVSKRYFLKNTKDFVNHTPDRDYADSAFLKAHPMASQSYDWTQNEKKEPDLVNVSEWHRSEIALFIQTGLVPNALMNQYQTPITRAEFVTLLVNLCEKVKGVGVKAQNGLCPFTDLAGHPYQREITAAWSLGITQGKTETQFKPDDVLTRQEAAKMLCTALEVMKGLTVPLNGYASISYSDEGNIGSWAMPYVSYATKQGVMSGDGRYFFPTRNITREEGAAVVWRLSQQFSLLAA
jgi:transglutaminase-like putative cysteine protease